MHSPKKTSPAVACILGNSHTIAIRDGWKAAPCSAAQWEPTFCSIPSNLTAWRRVENYRLTPHDLRASNRLEATSGGLAAVEVPCFGLFVLPKMFIHFRRFLNIHRSHALDAALAGSRDLTSPAAVAAAAEPQIRTSGAHHVALLLREVSAAPIILMPEPLVRKTVIDLPAERAVWSDPAIPKTCDTKTLGLRPMGNSCREARMPPAAGAIGPRPHPFFTNSSPWLPA